MTQRINKIVLAYSGGLDTSVMIKWLKEKYQAEIIAVAADLGQGKELVNLEEKAINTGASKIYIEDLREDFINEYIFPALAANAIYEGKYLLATSLSRPLIAERLVEIALIEKADALAHGCTGKGNDQVRFETAFYTLAPYLKIIAPARTWEFKSREEEIVYAQKHQIPINVTKKSPYSIDRNLWGVSIECGLLEDPWVEPPKNAYQITISPQEAPDKPEYLEVYFEEGKPVGINEKEKMKGIKLIECLNTIGGKHGIGRVDMVEDRLVGIKSREIYEAPAATILYKAHKELESLVLDRETLYFKEIISQKYSHLIYQGLWFTPLKDSLDAFIKKTQEKVSGKVRLKLYKGVAEVVGRHSENSLYDQKLATYDEGDLFDHKAAEGFIKLWSLPYQKTGKNI
ncbi:MAG: argininosuccinate synthase [bacterium]|nr:argininosuccinate synthase [bacterium]